MIYLDERTVREWIESLKSLKRQKIYMDKEEIDLGFYNLANLYLNTVNRYNIEELTDKIFKLLPEEVKGFFEEFEVSYNEISNNLKKELNLEVITYEDIEEYSLDDIHEKFIIFYPNMIEKIKESFSDMNLVSMQDVLNRYFDDECINSFEMEFIFRIYDDFVSEDIYEKILKVNSYESRYLDIPEEVEKEFQESIESIIYSNSDVDYYNCFFSEKRKHCDWEKLSDMYKNFQDLIGNSYKIVINDEYNIFDNEFALIEVTPSFSSYEAHLIKKLIVFIYVFFYLLGGYECEI